MIFALIGPRGSGKTTVANRLSNLTGWPVVGTDDAIEKNAGRSITEIVSAGGWSSFRVLEKQALAACLDECERVTDPGKGVFLDTGGGLILDENSRRLLHEKTQVIYIHAPAEVLAARIADGADRPPLTNGADPVTEMKLIFAERDPLYLSIADLELDTNELGVEAMVTILMNWVTARCGVCEF